MEEDAVSEIFKINGKIKTRLDVSPNISDKELESMAMNDEAVRAELAGAQPKKVITKAPKFVNIVL